MRASQVAQQLEAELRGGRHGVPGDRFITVRQLAARYQVSLVTAHRVVQRLKRQGLLIGDSTHPAVIAPQAVRASRAAEAGFPRRLGMVITNIASPFFSRLCRHVQQAAAAHGYQVLMAGSQYDFQREKKAVEGFLEIGVEGLLVVPGLDESCVDWYRSLIDRGVRLVFVSRQVEGVPADFVVADSFAGSAAMAGHLMSMDYHSFGYIGFGPRLKRDARIRGLCSALSEEGITLAPQRIASGEGGGVEHGYRAMAELLRGRNRPRAVFAFHDLLAIGALRYCQEHSIRVPEEVAIAGFDDLPESQVTSPPLTTVRYPIESMARLAIQCLIEDRSGGPAGGVHHRVLLEPHVVVRRSTDPAAIVAAPLAQEQELYEIP
jgi:LacI family transcriptional regulator